MGLFIVEPAGLSSPIAVKGSAYLEEENNDVIADVFSKHAPGRPDLILVPTPSDDPEDPLNWSRAKKATQLLASLVLTIGVGSLVFASIQQKFGSRPSFLLALLTQTVSMLWAGGSGHSYPSLITARVVQGLSMGCFFNNVPAAVNSLFFVHERGLRMGLWNLSLIGGINLGPVISAQIIELEGWTFAFWWQGLIAGVTLIGSYLFMPEFFYDRSYYNKEILDRRLKAERGTTGSEKELSAASVVVNPAGDSTTSRWAVFNGVKSSDSFFKIMFRPFVHLTNPVVIWGCLTFSVVFNLLPFISAIYSSIFSAAPYNFTTGQIGLVSGIPPLIGTLIGTILAGPFSDWSVKFLSKRNHGVFESEFRLVPIALFLVLGGMGLFGWGMQQSGSWIVPAVFIAILHVGVSAGTISCIGYVSACTGADAADAVGVVVFVKSVIGFAILFVIPSWLAKVGVVKFMQTLGYLTVATCLLAVPAWIYGKVARNWYGNSRWQRFTKVVNESD
ncbi:MFS transporter [Pseudohyphozyma bogoriensis]|nr:MFS transporter [Pseudohyphozyma bogoriensis]